ncbi:hypothetical protein [Kaistia sp. MMO-174]|uniref:hypothetical protein n=1 Tax=Kaistia sp. MMO-174 TaxID=3081256 RepID=UPI00301834F0
MNSSSLQIGFDRFIKLDWASVSLRIRAGRGTLDELDEALASSHVGPAAKRKTRTVLNRLWLAPRADLVEFANRGVEIFSDGPETTVTALTWGMALATYPFFGKVAEIVGRLTTLQGDCTSAEVHRRMAEFYGEREGTRRMTNMVLQSQASWGAIERTDKGKRIERNKPMDLKGSTVSAWLAEACLRYHGRAIPVENIKSSPDIYPFLLGSSTAYLFSKYKSLEMRVDSAGNQIVGLAN